MLRQVHSTSRPARFNSLLALILLNAACVRYQPRALNPVQSEAAFRARTLALGTLDLQTLTTVALADNAGLNVARAKAAAADAAIVTARQRPNPSLTAEGGYNKTPDSAATYSFSPAFTIETAGKRGYRTLAAQKNAEAVRIEVAEAEWNVRNGVRSAAATLHFAEEKLALLRSEGALRDDVSGIFAKRVTLGEASNPEWNAARAERASLAINLRNAEGASAQALESLAAAIGVPVFAIEGRDFDLALFDNPPPPELLPLLRVQKAGLLHRADVRRTLVEYEAADARLRLELANRYPDISLNPAYSFQEGFPAYTLGSVLDSLPVFHRHEGPIAEAEAARRQVEAQFTALQAQAIGETELALRQYSAAFREWQAVKDSLEPIERRREAAVLASFAAGESDRLDVTQAKLRTLAAVRVKQDALSRAEAALGSLESAVQTSLGPETIH